MRRPGWGLSNPAIVGLSLLALLIVGGILWALVGERWLAVVHPGSPTPSPLATPSATPDALSPPGPRPSPKPEGSPPEPARLVGSWSEVINPEVVLVVVEDGSALRVTSPAELIGKYAPSGRRYQDDKRALELTDSDELVAVTEKGPDDSETRIFKRVARSTPPASPTGEATPAQTPPPAETPGASPVETPPPGEASPVATPATELTPEGGLARYYELINSDEFEAAYALRSQRSRETTNYARFLETWNNNRSIEMLDASATMEDPQHAVVTLHLKAEDFNRRSHKLETTVYEGQVRMVLEDGEWRYDGTIQGRDFTPVR